ncbi:hypothetical protein KSP40_PGU008684 [Platanthera guangdongensis]|uniref:Uncharacterized protein n=1 Tax=Platanthera guangdongensis TaxID=2320717 RepID=A0ABR2LRK6_9ASPA
MMAVKPSNWNAAAKVNLPSRIKTVLCSGLALKETKTARFVSMRFRTYLLLY